MKYYDNDEKYQKRIHTVKVTLQSQDYKGHIAYEVQGNVLGLNVLRFESHDVCEDDISNFTLNDCKFKVDNLDNFFSVRLKNDQGDVLVLDYLDDCDVDNMVVAIEIIDYVED